MQEEKKEEWQESAIQSLDEKQIDYSGQLAQLQAQEKTSNPSTWYQHALLACLGELALWERELNKETETGQKKITRREDGTPEWKFRVVKKFTQCLLEHKDGDWPRALEKLVGNQDNKSALVVQRDKTPIVQAKKMLGLITFGVFSHKSRGARLLDQLTDIIQKERRARTLYESFNEDGSPAPCLGWSWRRMG